MRFLFILLSLSFLTEGEAAVRLPSVLGDHMVLQRNSTVKLWGWSAPSEQIAITPSWDGHTYETKASNNARWQISLTTPEAGGPYAISFKASNEVVLEDILIGEIWICSGQSNMEWSANNGFDNSETEVTSANFPNIRFFQIPKTTSNYPQDDCEAVWEVCTPQSFQDFSAVAYFFGRHLQTELDVPIGLIQAAWEGTAAEVWTPKEVILADKDFSKWDDALSNSLWWPKEPAMAYNAMIHPVTPFKIAGAIWYQGESNTGNAEVYKRLFPAMIDSWREAWDFPLPFYYVQIAPYNYSLPVIGAQLREAQLQSLSVPRTGMVVVSDIGNNYDIHPRNKQDVGKRLADWALARTYGKSNIVYSGPVYKSHRIQDGKMYLKFDFSDDGLLADGPLTNFTLAAEDQIFVPATAQIEGDEVVVESQYVLTPVAARYGFTNIVTPNLKNRHGLPASTFRTDNWPIRSLPVRINITYQPEAEAYLVSLTGEFAEEIKYSINGDPAALFGLTYRQPFFIEKECVIEAVAFQGGLASDHYIRKEVKLNLATFKPSTYRGGGFHPSRSGGGDQGLIDGEVGSENINDGHWQGFQNADLDFVMDFGARLEIHSIKINAIKNQTARVFLPNKVTFEVSNDGERFVEVYRKPLFHARNEAVDITTYDFQFKNSRKGRYVRVRAENIGVCPSWHSDAGELAWLMVDEIVIN